MANDRSEPQSEELTGEHALTDVGQSVLLVLFAVVWVVDSFFLRWTTFLNGAVPIAVRAPITVSLSILALVLGLQSHRVVFGKTPVGARVVRQGVFSLVRHPMYLAEILFYLAFLVISMSLAASAVWIVTILFLDHVARTEEKLLLARFGEAYAAYGRDVGRWIPRIWRH